MREKGLFSSRDRRSLTKARNFRRTVKKLWNELKPWRAALILAIVLAAASALFSLGGPKVLALAVDELISGALRIVTGVEGGVNLRAVGLLLLILAGLYGFSAVCAWLQGRLTAGIAANIARELREKLNEKLFRLSLAEFRKTGREDALGRITGGVDQVAWFLDRGAGQGVRAAWVLVGVPVLLLTVSWQLTLVTLLLLSLGLALALLFSRLLEERGKSRRDAADQAAERVKELYVRAAEGKADGAEEFDRASEALYRAGWKAQFLSGLTGPAAVLAAGLGYGVLCLAGAALAAGGSLTAGSLLAFLLYVYMGARTAVRSAGLPEELWKTARSAEGIFELLGAEEEAPEEPKLTVKEAGLQGELCFDHVKFGYEDTHELVLRDFSAQIHAGWRVAIVGPDGAGKTTLIRLLLRFCQPKDGQITVDGRPITDFSRADLRSAFAVVSGDGWLYGGTVLDNLRYGRPGAAEEEAVAAAKAVQADGLIRSLPQGYQTVLHEDSLTRGQRLLLSMARALLRDAPVVLLEEGAAPEDQETEKLLQKAVERLTEGRTSLIVAARPPTVQNADLVLYMEDGDVVEQGTHWELMVQGGRYARLYSLQIEGKGRNPV